MNEKLKKFKYVQYLVNVIFLGAMMVYGNYAAAKLPNQIYELDLLHFYLYLVVILISFCLLCYVVYFVSIIIHEVGHLIFGLCSKLNFVSFNVYKYTFYIEDNKLKVEKDTKTPSIMGYCNMSFDKDKKYSKKNMIIYMLGGIIFNLILMIISIILMVYTNNVYLKLVYILIITINSYLAIYNAIPAVAKSGVASDALNIIYCLSDDEYINTLSRLNVLQSMLAKGCKLKDIDKNLLCKPDTFKTNSDVLNALFYVDYLCSNEKYYEASEYAKKILKEAKDFVSKPNMISLKLSLISCIFYTNDNLDEIKELWSEEIKKYLDFIGKIVPVGIAYNYLYATLIEKNEDNSKKYLNQFQQLNKKKYDKYQIEEAEKLINDVNKRKESLK